MKVSELLVEAPEALVVKVLQKLKGELITMGEHLGDQLHQSGAIDEPDPVFSAMTAIIGDRPTLVVIRRSRPPIPGDVWSDCIDEIKHFLKDEGYAGGVLPVDVGVVITSSSTVRLTAI